MVITNTYKTQSEDTDIVSEIVLFSLWRSWNITKKAIHLNHNTHNARSTAWYIAKLRLRQLRT